MKFALFLLLLTQVAGWAAAEKPNVLFIFADDMTYEAIHAFGYDEIETPNLDRLVAEGTTFTHAYNSGGWHGAICVASRTMLMTGRQLWHAHKVDNKAKLETEYAAQGKAWSQLMAAAGYETFMTGKWHVQIDPERIFDHVRHQRPGMPKTVKDSYNRPLKGKKDPWDPADPSVGGFWQGGKHWSEVQADDAIDFLGMAKKTEKPFFIYLAFNAPHDPRQSPQEYLDKYPVDQVKVPENFLEAYPYRNEMGSPITLRDEKLAPMPRTKHSIQVHRREYHALITHMDAQIGRVLAALKESGMAGTTQIVFTADHGLAVGRHGLLGKQNLYDHSVRVPFIMVGPGVPKGEKRRAPIYLQDVIPTALTWAGAEVPEHVQFESVLPHLVKSGEARSSIYGAYRDLQRSVTMGGCKLIVYPKAKIARLYHLSDDPFEMDDLLEKTKDPGGMNQVAATILLAELRRLGKEMGDEVVLEDAWLRGGVTSKP
jgi:arylsulfatase A-like enzyme